MATLYHASDLDFHREPTTTGPHGLHAFGAKLPPQLPRWAIDKYSQAGDIVCDPMCGSGTTLVEAVAANRVAVGFDLDPLACLISAAKSTPIDFRALGAANERLRERLLAARADAPASILPSTYPAWRGVALPAKERWFEAAVAAELCLIKGVVAEIEVDPAIRRVWQALFSSLITARTSVASARDIVHSRHHYRAHASAPDAIGRFLRRLSEAERRITDVVDGADGGSPAAMVVCADSRALPLASGRVDLIVTSPPYCNALDYTRAHRFSVAWMEQELGVTFAEYVARGRRYIGAQRGVFIGAAPEPVGIETVDAIGERILAQDRLRGRLVKRYIDDMRRVIAEFARVLTTGGHAVIVVCPSNIRQIAVEWQDVFSRLAVALPAGDRLETVELIERRIDDSRRILPYMNGGTRLSARMHREFVLVLRKTGGIAR